MLVSESSKSSQNELQDIIKVNVWREDNFPGLDCIISDAFIKERKDIRNGRISSSERFRDELKDVGNFWKLERSRIQIFPGLSRRRHLS